MLTVLYWCIGLCVLQLIYILIFEKGSIKEIFEGSLGFSTFIAFVFGIIFVVNTGINIIENRLDGTYESNSSDHEYYYEDYYEDYNQDPGIHHVQPHRVNGYYRSDGTYVEGYWRGGTDGYYRSNPDGNPFNNLNR